MNQYVIVSWQPGAHIPRLLHCGHLDWANASSLCRTFLEASKLPPNRVQLFRLALDDSGAISGWVIVDDWLSHVENPKEISKVFAEREKSAASFCETYTCWANGHIYGWTLTDANGEMLDSCGGYYGNDTDYMIESVHDAIRHHTGDERGVVVRIEGDAKDYWKSYRCSEEEAAWRLGHEED